MEVATGIPRAIARVAHALNAEEVVVTAAGVVDVMEVAKAEMMEDATTAATTIAVMAVATKAPVDVTADVTVDVTTLPTAIHVASHAHPVVNPITDMDTVMARSSFWLIS